MDQKIDKLFKKHKGQFDIETPDAGHFDRFERKLNANSQPTTRKRLKLYSIVAIAASVVLLGGVRLGTYISNNPGMELAQISTEMADTQDFFGSTNPKEVG